MSGISLSDSLAFCALALSIYSVFRQVQNEKLAPLKSDVLQGIRDLKSLTTFVSEAIINHITFSATRAEKEHIYGFERQSTNERASLELRLECKKDEIFRQYTDWWNAVSASFPVETKSAAVKASSAEVQNIKKAQMELNTFLDALLISCHRGKLKIR